jgi:hypothetical protein
MLDLVINALKFLLVAGLTVFFMEIWGHIGNSGILNGGSLASLGIFLRLV